MGDYDDRAPDFDDRIPDDVHPDDVGDYMRDRYSVDTMGDAFIDEIAERVADRRRAQGRVPDDPRTVGREPERGRSDSVGQITYDSEANRWRDAETGHFVSEDQL